MLERREFLGRAAVAAAILLVAFAVAVLAQAPARGMVSLKSKTWGVSVDLTGFQIEINETRADGRRYLFAAKKDAGFGFSIFLEEMIPGAKVKGCRENLELRAQSKDFEKTDVKLSERDKWTVLEYVIPKHQGVAIRQKNIFLCQLRDEVFIDLHLSKTSYEPPDAASLQAVIDSLEIREGITRTVMDYMEVASRHYLSRNYKLAIPSYAKALELEKQSPQLEKKLWYVLIDNLGIAYGSTGEVQKAKEIFEYGLSKDAEYPLFYYNLACAYAEMGDKEQTVANLKKAFERKANLLPGEEMPDAATDDSFQKLMKDRDFRDFVNSLQKTPAAAGFANPAKGAPPAAGEANELREVFKIIKTDSGSSVRGTLRDQSGPISDAEIVLQSMKDDRCVEAFNSKAPTEKDVKVLRSCLKDLPPVRPDANGTFEIKDLRPGIYNLRILWNIQPKPKELPAVYRDGGFLVMCSATKDPSGRYDALAQVEPFRIRNKESAVIQFFDERKHVITLQGRP
ncbi:MAG TPA: hypothetical protein VNL38_03510 [Candidatus Nitrosotenuis sp.]|nr:hypothetical protein [Candidatus Nitrosotenuis sp.]